MFIFLVNLEGKLSCSLYVKHSYANSCKMSQTLNTRVT